MAIRFGCSPHPILARMKANGTWARVSRLPSGGEVTPTRTTATLLVKSSTTNKVFEDQALGIVCYRDEHGEVICQGYDEGPRYTREASPVVRCERSLGARKGLQIPELQLPRRARTVEGPAGVLCINGFPAEERDAH